MRRLLALALALALLALSVSPALAVEGELLFPAVNAYAGFADVAEGDWFAPAVALCAETGLMNGTGDGAFSPYGTITVGETAALAARIRERLTGAAIPRATPLLGETRAWYQDYLDYLSAAVAPTGSAYFDLIPWDAPEAPATRQQFLALLMLALAEEGSFYPSRGFPAINAIDALPDVEGDGVVLFFYNAGILTGVDASGTFAGERTLQRAEAAAMAARIADPGLRQRFTPQPAPTAGPSFQEELDGTTALLINGQAVTMKEFVTAMDWLILEQDRTLYRATGQRLAWDGDYGVGELGAYFLARTQDSLVRSTLLEQQARALGCETDQLAQRLTPSPSPEVLDAYAQGMGYLAAQHILIQTADPATGAVTRSEAEALALAEELVAALDADPSPQRFRELMDRYNDDPGMAAYPEGYLFLPGEMVAEFEQGVRDLAVGAHSPQPVKSAYGYHVILRLDPAALGELRELYQQAVLDTLVQTWTGEATVTANTVMLDRLDVRGCYESFWNQLAAQGG